MTNYVPNPVFAEIRAKKQSAGLDYYMKHLAVEHNDVWEDSDVYTPTEADWLLVDHHRKYSGSEPYLSPIDPLADPRFNPPTSTTLPKCNSLNEVKTYVSETGRGGLCHGKLKVGRANLKHLGWFKATVEGTPVYAVVVSDSKATENTLAYTRKHGALLRSRKLKSDGTRLVFLREFRTEVS